VLDFDSNDEANKYAIRMVNVEGVISLVGLFRIKVEEVVEIII